MSYTLVTAAAEKPVSIAEAKDHLRVDHTSEDAVIAMAIGTSTKYAQDATRRQFVSATYDLFMDSFADPNYTDCDGNIRIPLSPLQSVTSIAYVDNNGDSQTWSSAEYVVDTSVEPGLIRLAYNQSYPNTRTQPQAVTIRYIAGYGAATAVPDLAKSMVLLGVGDLYENRESQQDVRLEDNTTIERLMWILRAEVV